MHDDKNIVQPVYYLPVHSIHTQQNSWKPSINNSLNMALLGVSSPLICVPYKRKIKVLDKTFIW